MEWHTNCSTVVCDYSVLLKCMQVYTRVEKLMGSVFTLGIATTSSEQAGLLLNMGIAEIKRIEDLLSEFRPESETSLINSTAYHAPVSVSEECFTILKRSLDISRLSKGDFDITIGPLKKLYRFKNDQFAFPSAVAVQEVLDKVGYHKVQLSDATQTVRFMAEGMQISFAAIGKGYAADRVKALWTSAGVTSGYINASGDLCAFGHKPDGEPWTIGIAHPDRPSETLFYLPLQDAAVATSGDYEQHFVYEGKRYSHNINPHTGLPLSGIKSVSVFAPAAELADALATVVYVKGVEKGLHFIDQLPYTHCIIVDVDNRIHTSTQLSLSV